MARTNDDSWIEDLREAELLGIVLNPEEVAKREALDPESKIRLWRVANGLPTIIADTDGTIEGIGTLLLPTAIDSGGPYGVWPDWYWRELKREVKIFICTSDKKYADLRKRLSTSADKSQTAIVSAIAAGMAAQFGVVAGLLVPFIALCLVVLARIGKEAFCTTLEWNMPLHASGKPKKG
jgi:hypothetical protein